MLVRLTIRNSIIGFVDVFKSFNALLASCKYNVLPKRFQTSFSSFHDCPDYWSFVQRHKRAAQCSLVLEDCTRSGFVWHQTEQDINQRLLKGKASRIYRWRCGGRNGEGILKRLLLVEFDNVEKLNSASFHLNSQHNLNIFNQMCFIHDSHIKAWSSTNKKSYKILVKFKSDSPYQIVQTEPKSDGKVIIPFEYYNPPPMPSGLVDKSSVQMDSLNKLLLGQGLISDLQFKIRFFIIHQMETVIRRYSRLYATKSIESLEQNPNLMDIYEIVPFGSDASGFGTPDSDLDLCLIQKGNLRQLNRRGKRSVLHTILSYLKKSIQISSGMHTTLYSNAIAIYAFVSIIKCRSRLLPELNIDISSDADNCSGVKMAEYLYYCSRADPRVYPFLVTLKAWARHHKIIATVQPSPKFSTFHLTALAVAFLQKQNIVLSINKWKSSKSERKNIQTIQARDVYNLLADFFEYMIHFDFCQYAFDLNTGESTVAKSNPELNLKFKTKQPYVVNPFRTQLNICKAVSETELERFLSCCQHSSTTMSKSDRFKLEDLFQLPDNRQHAMSF